MDVPFHSSGALSRAHYSIVRKVETADTVQTADQHIFLEINSVQEQLAHPRLSIDKCKECLIILLYCATSVTPGFIASDAFEFAFPHAINLAEAGSKVEDKRIGYLFCSDMVPLDHELRLMLVNTIRKDLESEIVPRVCMALDNLIVSPSEAVIPAVQARLHHLLSYDNPHVKRRALLAIRALSTYEPVLIDRIQTAIILRLEDPDVSVVRTALALLGDNPPQDNSLLLKGKDRANMILNTKSSRINGSTVGIILQAMKTIRVLGPDDASIPVFLKILQKYSYPKGKKALSGAVILDVFKTISQLGANVVASVQKSRKISIIHYIRHFLMSKVVNEDYLFISCLECLDVVSWAGTTPGQPSVLEPEEFEKIMQLLDAPDQAIARKTMRIVNKVDPSLLDMQMSLKIQSLFGDTANSKVITTLLDICFIRYAEDGSRYTVNMLELIRNVEKTESKPRVFKEIVESVLLNMRTSQSVNFTSSAASQFVQSLLETEAPLGPTALVIASALTTEFFGSLTSTPQQLLCGLAFSLKTCSPIVQEPCILAMMRVSVECPEISPEVVDLITKISKTARQVIRDRCNQFIEYSQRKEVLRQIIQEALSSSLPDFLSAVQGHAATDDEIGSSRSSPQLSGLLSGSTKSKSGLKYAAYALPQVGPRLRVRRRSSSPMSRTSSQLASPPITAGQLTLRAGLEDIHSRDTEPLESPDAPPTLIDFQASRTELISLESPFQTEPPKSFEQADDKPAFGDIWDSFESCCDLRGWSKSSIDTMTRRLQSFDDHHCLRVIAADVSPFKGEHKLLLVTGETSLCNDAIALRIRVLEEGSCLWRLRCTDVLLGTQIQRMLELQ